ncbi:MAG: hypothetical protein Q8918_00765 [Bacteroidota bacterium]|nr:hypothetical protein [Bacteroidota bacterium]MDP4211391.1 hypothetical protein [Bacteroidota bacterium]MDP4248618.1 hypothetical protein [Bacteroidota bacterium]
MKKVLLSAFAGLSIICATTAFTSRTGSELGFRQTLRDTVPPDTTKPSKADLNLAYANQANYLVRDTVPPDTTKASKAGLDLANANQVNRVIRDTVPGDTTKPAKLSLDVAYVN